MPEQPDLWGFWNSGAINDDELNGGGNNWPVSPAQVDLFEARVPFIVTTELLEVFDGCPDYAVPAVVDTHVVRPEFEELVVR